MPPPFSGAYAPGDQAAPPGIAHHGRDHRRRPRPLVIVYLDTSAAMKLLVEGDESPGFHTFRGGAARPCTMIGSALSGTSRTKQSFEPSKKLSHSCPADSRRFTLSATAVARRRERVVARPGTQVAPVWQGRAAARTTGSCSVEPSGLLAAASGRIVPHSSSRRRSRPRSGLRPRRRKFRGRVRRYLCSQRPPATTSSTGPYASAYGLDARFHGRVPSAATGSAVITQLRHREVAGHQQRLPDGGGGVKNGELHGANPPLRIHQERQTLEAELAGRTERR